MQATRQSKVLTQYLLDAVQRRGLRSRSQPDMGMLLDPATPPEKAWSAVAECYGIDVVQLAQHVASYFRLDVADPASIKTHAAKLIPDRIARKYQVCPIGEENRRIVIATADPTNIDAEQAVGFASGRIPSFVIAAPQTIASLIDRVYASEQAVENLLNRLDAEITEAVQVVEEIAPEALATEDIESAPVVKLTNLILRDAVQQNSSDIHIEPGRNGGTVRFRVDGVLRLYMQLPLAALNRVVSRIKILGKIDIADRVRPHDGRARIQIEGHVYDFRISTVPVRDAEKAVIRILDPSRVFTLDDLGMGPAELYRFRTLLGYRTGMVLVTGPTGSGKTTTMYAGIRELARPDVNIMTVEDPVEYEFGAINQIQVETRRGVTFASALRAILRQDPDIIFVGEIRDLETAEIAVQACMTGHLVLATLHTNDAMSVVSRLTELGLNRTSIASTLRGVVAQRLVRKVCGDCARPIDQLTEKERELSERYDVVPRMRAVGCDKCGKSGYRGRFPLDEVAMVTSDIQSMIAQGKPDFELQAAVIAGGMRSLRQNALTLVQEGKTTIEEIDRVVGEDPEAVTAARSSGAGKVLVVDDDPVTRKVAKKILEKDDYLVREAGDGQAAVDILDKEPDYSLMVLDLEMPRMGGREVLSVIRKRPQTAALPVIVLTGDTDPDGEIRLMEDGADDYLRKPIDGALFKARVKGALRRAGVA